MKPPLLQILLLLVAVLISNTVASNARADNHMLKDRTEQPERESIQHEGKWDAYHRDLQFFVSSNRRRRSRGRYMSSSKSSSSKSKGARRNRPNRGAANTQFPTFSPPNRNEQPSLPNIDRDRDPLEDGGWSRKRVDMIRDDSLPSPTIVPTNENNTSPTIAPVPTSTPSDNTSNGTVVPQPPAMSATSAPTVSGAAGTTAPTISDATSAPTILGATNAPTILASTNAPTILSDTSAPSISTATTAPTISSTTTAPTIPGDTDAPTAEIAAAATEAPTALGTTTAPTVSGSAGDSTTAPTVPGTAVGATAAPTVSEATAGATVAPTVLAEELAAGATVAPSVAVAADLLDAAVVRSSSSTKSYATNRASNNLGVNCAGGPQDFAFGIDLHVNFVDNHFHACNGKEFDAIATVLQITLNMAFPSQVPSWSGQVDFYSFKFDVDQFDLHINPYASASTARAVKKSNIRHLLRNGGEDHQKQNDYEDFVSDNNNNYNIYDNKNGSKRNRKLQESEKCPARPALCLSGTDVCLFGCGIVSVADCSSDLTLWKDLSRSLTKAISALELPCLGGVPDIVFSILPL